MFVEIEKFLKKLKGGYNNYDYKIYTIGIDENIIHFYFDPLGFA